MSAEKKAIREAFRSSVFARDGNKCRVCGWMIFNEECKLDAHHITDRNIMPNGGYVLQNGISLCPACHEKAEVFHSTGSAHPGFSVEELYTLINSSLESALEASHKLSKRKS